MFDDEDIEINTSNQTEQALKIAKKKSKLVSQKKPLKTGAKNGVKNVKKKAFEDSKRPAAKPRSRTDDDDALQDAKSYDDGKRESRPAKNRTTGNNFKSGNKGFSSGGQSVNKAAKFSSLFKNNHAIPNVGDVTADDSVKEKVFSSNWFSELNLSAHLTDCLQKRFELKKMTQIQEKAIPAILNGSDCFVKSQTGSGKTLAYAIPIVQKLQGIAPRLKRTDGIRALVLVPTRELAIQTCQVFEKLCNACVWIVPGSLIGGMKKKSEKDRIRRGLNILVATPGRLCDHLDTTEKLDLSKVEFLVFDEADRMLDMDFEKKINFIIFKIHSSKKKALSEPHIPKFKLDENGEPVEDPEATAASQASKRLDPQTILISATLNSGIKEIARRLNIDDAIVIDAAGSKSKSRNEEEADEDESQESKEEKVALPAGLSHYYLLAPSKLRLISLISFILGKVAYKAESNINKIVIFAATNDSVQFHENILSTFLNRKFNMYLDHEDGGDDSDYDYSEFGIDSSQKKKPKGIDNSKNTVCDLFSLYGNMDQHKRVEILSKFCKASQGVLVCTDVAARGLDMPKIDWIIQYNTPGSCVDYVHRVGRTARVGHKGKAVIFLEPCEIEYLKELNKLGISLHELKLESVMDCLVDEAKYYPRQMNVDRLITPKNSEEAANSMQFYIEEYVEKSSEVHALARKAYLSFLRSYSCYSHEWKRIFHIKNLHVGHVAKSFGLREAPNQIVGNDMRGSKGPRRVEGKPGANRINNKKPAKTSEDGMNPFDDDYDHLVSKYARDLKRISNNHKEYGNVIKKNKLKSQKSNVDLSGLLKRHSFVDEYSAGLNGDQGKPKKRSFAKAPGAAESKDEKVRAPPKKMAKKDMSIFD